MDTISADGHTDCLEDFLSVVVVSSSYSAHPDTTLIEKSIRSLHRLTKSATDRGVETRFRSLSLGSRNREILCE